MGSIVINARFLTQKITGVQRYGIELCRALKILDPTIRLVAPKNIIHPEIAQELGVEVFGFFSGHIWEQVELPLFLLKKKQPLLLCLANVAPLFYKRKVVNVHDIVFEHYPNAVSWKFRLWYQFLIPKVIKSALHVTTDSVFSKCDICSCYQIDESLFTVIYLGVEMNNRVKKVAQKENVILSVGSIQPYKNIERLITAFLDVQLRSNNKYILKLVGGSNNKVFNNPNLLRKVEQRNDIVYTGYLSDDELNATYASAKLFVFPSLFEGFGLPPLEAMAHGCPVLASNAASIPEVCGDAAMYCDPMNEREMSDKMLTILESEQQQQQMTILGYEQIKQFTWLSSARQMLDVVNKYR